MASNFLQSAWLRFFRKFGVAFFWALGIGLLLGSASFFRLDRRDLEGDPRWHVLARLWLERVEWATFDWRARELGAESDRADDVVLVNIDEETALNARESDHPEWAMNPWPRDLLGSVAEQALREGASLVILDESLSDVSAHHCPACRGADARKTDDELLGARLERLAGRVALSAEWSKKSARPADRPLTPFLMKVAEFEDVRAALGATRQLFARHATAYLLPVEGKWALWGGATSDSKVKDLANALDVKSPVFRGLTPADDEHEVTREWLARQVMQIPAMGIDPDSLTQATTIDAPVPPLLSPTAVLGLGTMTPDADGVVRALPLLVSTSDSQPVVLPSVVVRAISANDPKAITFVSGRASVVLGPMIEGADRVRVVPIDTFSYLTLQWNDDETGKGGRGTMKRSIPAWRLLVNHDDDDSGRGIRHHDNDLAKRIVVITDARRGDRELYATPIGKLSRAAIVAQGVTNVLHGQGIERTRPEVDFWVTIGFALIGGALAVTWSSLVRRPGWLAWVATIVIVAALQAFISRQLFVTQHRWVAMAAPLLAFTATFLASLGYAGAIEQSLREFVFRALGGAVRADVFRQVERDLALMRPERRDLTMYFSDIEGFTAVAQANEPQVVVEVLQDYLSEMTTLVLDRDGHVDKYLGDGLMAFWGAPVALSDSPAVACDTALAMQAKFEARRAQWEKKCGRPLALRAGIERGPTLVGEMGTLHRVNYTVMGEPVAMAFRLESLAKRYDANILVGPEVASSAGPNFVFREVDTVRLGRATAPIRLYELVGRAADLEGEKGTLEKHARAIDAWRSRRFDEALSLFKELLAQHPTDRLIERYVERCEKAKTTPPPDSWDGVFDDLD